MDDGVRRAPNKDQWIEGLEDKSSVERRDHGTEPRARAGRNVSSSVGWAGGVLGCIRARAKPNG